MVRLIQFECDCGARWNFNTDAQETPEAPICERCQKPMILQKKADDANV